MKEYIALLEDLIRCRPVSSNIPAVNNATMRMRDFLSAHGLYCTLEEAPDGRKLLYAAPREGKTPDYLLNAHLDVVPAEESMFTPTHQGNRMYGRGATDCLGNAVAVARALVLAGKDGKAGAFFSADEETGGDTTALMVRKGYAAKKMVIIMDANPWSITYAQKGILNVKLTARGKAGHAAAPWDSDNALDRLIDGYVKIRNAWPEMKPEIYGDSLAATICQCGSVINRIPEIAEMKLNIRYVTPGGEEKILQMIRSVSGLEAEALDDRCPPVACDPEAPALKELRQTMEKAFNRPIALERLCGATDARHFPQETPVAILGIAGEGCHSDGEWSDLDCIQAYSEMLAGFIKA